MPLRVEGARVSLGSAPVTGRRSRGLADIAPQYVAKSGLCSASELEGGRGTSFRIQHVTGSATVTEGGSRFPKLDECAHFHYEHVELGRIVVRLLDEDDVKPLSQDRDNIKYWYLSVESQGKTWMIRRSYDNFRMLDEQLHRCIYDRKFSGLQELPEDLQPDDNILSLFLAGFSKIAGSCINCGPVLNWLEMDNRGRRLLVPDTDTCPINTPAVAAAYTVKRYQAQAPDELSFEVGDMISVIDMPPPEESIWWRGKREYMVGFFPSECVSVIGEKVPRNLRLHSPPVEPSKSVLRKHGKLIAFFRSFILSRPSRRRLKQSGILKERVFGCDLGEHLLNSGYDIPLVLKYCAEFIETHGIVDGIYRLSGINSNIIKLRNAFDEDRVPALYDDLSIRQDIHSVASLVKMYFRELPNPLCTYQLYHQFVCAVQENRTQEDKLNKMKDVVNQLPPPHYRTLEYLMKHLAKVAQRAAETGMTPRNVAIVWAPNLLRCKEFEIGGAAALQFVGIQAVVTEFLVSYVDFIFTECESPSIGLEDKTGQSRKSRPKSLAISTPTKLLPLEEAQSRILKGDQEYIEVGGGPASLPPQYHTVIDLPRKRPGSKRSPLGWRKFFSGRGNKSANNGHQRKSSTPADIGREKPLTEADVQASKRRLRPAKSAESMSSSNVSPAVQSPSQVRSPKLLMPIDSKTSNHNRSTSHESYFDTLLDNPEDDAVFESPLDISEIQVNFDLEESEMRIFSEDETLGGSGSLSFGSPRPNKLSKSLLMNKRMTNVKLARVDDSLSSSHSADPSPKKQKTQETEPCGRSRLEERLSTSAGELQFIDSASPDQLWVQAEVHPIQSPSPVSSLSHVSSLVPPSSPILPHIPHLNVKETTLLDASDTETPSLHSSTLTTPDTPIATTAYAPLIESPDPPRPEERRQKPYHPYENISSLVKPSVILETSFDVIEPLPCPQNNRDSVGSVKYELISTESSCDSLIDLKRTDESLNLIGGNRSSELFMDQSPSKELELVTNIADNLTNPETEFQPIEQSNEPVLDISHVTSWEEPILECCEEEAETENMTVESKEKCVVDILNNLVMDQSESHSNENNVLQDGTLTPRLSLAGSPENISKNGQVLIENGDQICECEELKMEVSEVSLKDVYGDKDQKETLKDFMIDLKESSKSSAENELVTEMEVAEKEGRNSSKNSEEEITEMEVADKESRDSSLESSVISSDDNLSGVAAIFSRRSSSNASSSSRRGSSSLSKTSTEPSDTEDSSETQVTEISSQKIVDGGSSAKINIKEELLMETSENVNMDTKEVENVCKKNDEIEEKPVQRIVKPPRKVFREVQSSEQSHWDNAKPFMEIAKLEKSPTLHGNRRFSMESPCDTVTSVIESIDKINRRPRTVSSQGTPELLKVTARLSDTSPVSSTRTTPVTSPRKVKITTEERQEWSMETPQRSNSSGNVRQLLNKFETCERPRTLERMSTRRTREVAELDLNDPERRERIEKYKEKRRTYLREKYRTEIEAARRVAPFEKPPRKNVTSPTSSTPFNRRSFETPSVTIAGRRSFDAPTVSSLCRNSLTRTSGSERRFGSSAATVEGRISPDKHRSLDYVMPDSRERPTSPLLSPRRRTSTPEATSPPYCIKDMAAKFEQRDRQSSSCSSPHKQYLSSV